MSSLRYHFFGEWAIHDFAETSNVSATQQWSEKAQTVTVHKARKVPHLPTNLSYSWLSMHIYLMWWTRLSTSYCLGRNQNHGPCPKNIPRYTCPIQPASWSTTRHFKGERAIKTAEFIFGSCSIAGLHPLWSGLQWTSIDNGEYPT